MSPINFFSKNKVNDDNYKIFLKNIFSSSHINFLFGSGVNGKLFPQMKSKELIKDIIEIIPHYDKNLQLEKNISDYYNENLEKIDDIHTKIINVFKKYNEKAIKKINEENDEDFLNFVDLIRKTVEIIDETDNRNLSMKELNIFTLNYDTIIDEVLEKLNLQYMIYDSENIIQKSLIYESIPYDYNVKKFLSRINIFKLHGNIKNCKIIVPSSKKYEEIIESNFFELQSAFKRKLERKNSILITIGYGFSDLHINTIIKNLIQKQMLLINLNYGEKIPENLKKFKNDIQLHSKKIINIMHSEKENSTKYLFNLLKDNVLSNEK